MLWFEKSHGQKDKVTTNDLLVSIELHDWSSTLWIGLPHHTFHFGSREFAVFADEAIGVE